MVANSLGVKSELFSDGAEKLAYYLESTRCIWRPEVKGQKKTISEYMDSK